MLLMPTPLIFQNKLDKKEKSRRAITSDENLQRITAAAQMLAGL